MKMKKIIVLVAFVLCIMLMSCFDFNFGTSLEGNWTLIGYIDEIFTEDTSYTSGSFYDPEVDQYYWAMILNIGDNRIISYNDLSGAEYDIDTMYTVSYDDDSLYLCDIYSEDSIAISYYFNEDHHLVWVTNPDVNYRSEMHLEKYTGQIPPDSWLTDLSDDQYEPDNDMDHATLLPMNDVQSHTLTENDTDYYHIQARAGRSYLIRGLSYFEMQLYLYDSAGDSIAYDNNNDLRILDLGDATESALLWTCDVTGDYYPMIVSGRIFPWNSLWNTQKGYYQMVAEVVDTNDIEYGPVDLPTIGYRASKGFDMFKSMLNK